MRKAGSYWPRGLEVYGEGVAGGLGVAVQERGVVRDDTEDLDLNPCKGGGISHGAEPVLGGDQWGASSGCAEFQMLLDTEWRARGCTGERSWDSSGCPGTQLGSLE